MALWGSLQVKFGLSYIAVIAAVLAGIMALIVK